MNRNSKTPERTCVGCRQVRKKNDLIRIVATEDGLAVDPEKKMNGRGVYVCPNKECIMTARKNNGLKRSLKRNIDNQEIEKIFVEIDSYEK